MLDFLWITSIVDPPAMSGHSHEMASQTVYRISGRWRVAFIVSFSKRSTNGQALGEGGDKCPRPPKKEKKEESEEKYQLLGAIQQCHDLAASAGCIGSELAIAGTAGNAVFCRPSDSLGIVGTIRNIAEGGAACQGRPRRPMQEGDSLPAGHRCAR